MQQASEVVLGVLDAYCFVTKMSKALMRECKNKKRTYP